MSIQRVWEMPSTDTFDVAPIKEKTMDKQLIRLNDWMSENEPDIYWSDGDTATAILRVVEKYKLAVQTNEQQAKLI